MVILIEARRFWLRISVCFAVVLAACVLALAGMPARAQTMPGSKVSSDLRQVIDARTTGNANWVKDIGSTRFVKVLIISNSPDPDLTELRQKILLSGGSVYYRYLSVTALSALVPAARVDEIAQRGDVQSISPNRLTKRTASVLELATGASNVRGTTSAQRLDGTGIGIAVLDSGVAWNHYSMRGANGQSRVARAVNVNASATTR